MESVMASINKVILVGYLGSDPEIRYTPSGAAVTNFRMATKEQWATKEGEKQERTEWHKLVVWGKLGEICGQYLHKGSMVYIEGRLQTRAWDDRDGNKRWTTEIIAQGMQMLDRAEKSGQPASFDDGPPPGETTDIREDEIPF